MSTLACKWYSIFMVDENHIPVSSWHTYITLVPAFPHSAISRPGSAAMHTRMSDCTSSVEDCH